MTKYLYYYFDNSLVLLEVTNVISEELIFEEEIFEKEEIIEPEETVSKIFILNKNIMEEINPADDVEGSVIDE